MAEIKMKMPVIVGCYQCSLYRELELESKKVCMHPDCIAFPDTPFGREIEDQISIQDWCPLEDYRRVETETKESEVDDEL